MKRVLRFGSGIAVLAFGCAVLQPEQMPTEQPPISTTVSEPTSLPTNTASPVPPSPTASPTEKVAGLPTPVPISDTLTSLMNAIVPPRDLREIALQLQGGIDIPVVVSEQAAGYAVGDVVTFWALNVDTNEKFQLEARLLHVTEHMYFFVHTAIDPNPAAVAEVAEHFETQIYPTNRAFFGSEWNPGVDGDPRLFILYARGLGFRVAGYYSSSDEYAHGAHEYSNEKEMIYINADTVALQLGSISTVLTHEFQHMIHWANDSNEATWINEGAAELARLVNGYGVSSFARAYLSNPDLQLNTWALPGESSAPHYGAGFLFLTYFLDRFGEAATQALIANPANGMRAVDSTLAELGFADSISGEQLTAVRVFADWAVANYLHDASLVDGRYAYPDFEGVPFVTEPTDLLLACPTELGNKTVNQFGVDYIEVSCPGTHILQFQGQASVPLMPSDPHSGAYMLWGNRQDNSVTRVRQSFDLSSVDAATLQYWTWFAIEEDFDYAYVEVSTDDGLTWTILEAPGGSSADPVGNNLGWGYNGFSGGGTSSEWIEERIDISAYAGREIMLRFEYVTDDAVNREGILLDDIAIPEIDYFEDFENGLGGWHMEGFVRIDNALPQTYVVSLIRRLSDGVQVERLELQADQTGQATLEIDSGESVVVVVSGTTLFTTEPAGYSLEIQ